VSGPAGAARIAVVGAGLGGLALAQSIRRTGLDVVVLEKDLSFAAPGRTVRVHCDPRLNEMAAGCLPPRLFELFVAGQSRPDARHIYLDERLVLVSVDERPAPELVLDTRTAREALAVGLGERLMLGAEVRAVRDLGPRAQLDLASGTRLEADLCVLAYGADAVGRQEFEYAPTVRDVGLWSFYGTVDLTESLDLALPAWLHEGFVVADDGEVKVAMGRYAPAGEFAALAAREGGDVPLRRRDYLFWNVIAPAIRYPSDPRLWGSSRAVVVGHLSAMTHRFDPWLHRLFGLAETDSYGFLPLRTSAPGAPRPESTRAILIGDAAHPMLPAALSTYVAFEDARVLGESLARALGASAPATTADAADATADAADATADAADATADAAAAAEASLRRSGFGHVAAAERAAGPAFGISGLTT
jgi:2-polyprenyl-6-methoxyphenol hydroxylase-like FAD-dependent oxidoreductase